MRTILNATKIENSINGKLGKDVLDFPFLIIRDCITVRGVHDRSNWEYHLIPDNIVTADDQILHEIKLSRELALKVIEKYNMKKVVSKKSGQIWEKEGSPFKKMYKHVVPNDVTAKAKKTETKKKTTTRTIRKTTVRNIPLAVASV